MACTHHQHAACAAQLILAGRFRCLVCEPHVPSSREMARVVDTGCDAAHSERVAAVLRAERADEVRRMRQSRPLPSLTRGALARASGAAKLNNVLAHTHTRTSRVSEKGQRACAFGHRHCLGGSCCFHNDTSPVSLGDDALLAACTFDYGTSASRIENLASQLRINMLRRRMPLVQAVECGVTGTLLAFAGIRLDELLPIYLLEELLALMHIDWPKFKLLDFSPLMLASVTDLPIIVLYDRLGMRASHLFEFTVAREALEAALGESGVALLRLRLECWPTRVLNE